MEWLSIHGVRCYGEPQNVPIRPITLLVGENSTGKSTLLAMVRTAWDLAYSYEEPSFNEEPFDFGAYHAIAYYHGGRGKFAHEFSIGAAFLTRRGGRHQKREIKATFKERDGQPFIATWIVRQENLVVETRRTDDDVKITLQRDGATVLESSVTLPVGLALSAALGQVIHGVTSTDAAKKLDVEYFYPLIFGRARGTEPRPIAGAPIRSHPERTYNPRRQVQEPEGSHVPFALATLASTSTTAFENLSGEMIRFGRASGLFSKVKVKRLGAKAGDPFQLQVAVDKFPFNVQTSATG
jgi:AAA domain